MKQKKDKPEKVEKWFAFMRRVYKVVKPIYPHVRHGYQGQMDDRSYIIMGNHKSILDVIPAAMATDRAVHYMAKSELFKKGISKWFTKKCECIPVERDGADVKAVIQAMKVLKSGGVICIFPEGTRNKTDEMFLPFKSGAAALAIKTKTPIVPMVQTKKIKAFKKAHVYFGEPMYLTEFYDKKLTQEDLERADKILFDKMTELYIKLQTDLENSRKKK